MTAKFHEVWTDYNDSQVKYRDATKKQLVRLCKVTNGSYSDQEIEEMLDEGHAQVTMNLN